MGRQRAVNRAVAKVKGNKKPETQMSQESNKNREMVLTDAKVDALQRLGALKGADRILQFFVYYFNGIAIKECARLCGYTYNGGYALIQRYRTESKLRERVATFLGGVPDEFRLIQQARLYKVASIHGKVLDMMEDNPKFAAERPTVLKQVMQTAGVLHEELPSVGTISIGTLNLLQAHVAQKIDSRLGPDRIQGDIVDMEDSEQ